eukprot:3509277-Prymnesium_polylepis.2
MAELGMHASEVVRLEGGLFRGGRAARLDPSEAARLLSGAEDADERSEAARLRSGGEDADERTDICSIVAADESSDDEDRSHEEEEDRVIARFQRQYA